MSELILRFSSKNRQKAGVSLSHDFTTRFNNQIKLPHNMKHEMAVRTLSMTYSWYNIRQSYGNNQVKYRFKKKDGSWENWETITFVDGMYSYDDIDGYIKKYMKDKGHTIKGADGKDKNPIDSKIITKNRVWYKSSRYNKRSR